MLPPAPRSSSSSKASCDTSSRSSRVTSCGKVPLHRQGIDLCSVMRRSSSLTRSEGSAAMTPVMTPVYRKRYVRVDIDHNSRSRSAGAHRKCVVAKNLDSVVDPERRRKFQRPPKTGYNFRHRSASVGDRRPASDVHTRQQATHARPERRRDTFIEQEIQKPFKTATTDTMRGNHGKRVPRARCDTFTDEGSNGLGSCASSEVWPEDCASRDLAAKTSWPTNNPDGYFKPISRPDKGDSSAFLSESVLLSRASTNSCTRGQASVTTLPPRPGKAPRGRLTESETKNDIASPPEMRAKGLNVVTELANMVSNLDAKFSKRWHTPYSDTPSTDTLCDEDHGHGLSQQRR